MVRQATKPQPSNRSFGLTFAGFFFVLVALKAFKGNFDAAIVLASCSLLCIAFALVAPHLLQPFNRLWMSFGDVMHRVTTPLIMGLVFYLIITPMGVVMRICGWDPLRLQYDKKAKSYWLERKLGERSSSMQNQF